MSCANPVSNVCCPPNDTTYAVSDLQEWTLTDLPMPWAYYRFAESSDSASREDATGQGHHLASTVLPNPSRVEGLITPWANELVSASRFETTDATMDSLEDEWSWHGWAHLETPDADNTLFIFGETTQNQIELRQLWDGVTLSYRLQAGYYAPPNDFLPYFNHVLVSGLTAPFNRWFFLAASFGGGLVTLAVDSQVNSIPILDNAGMDHNSLTQSFIHGPFTGHLGPVGIWTPDNHLSIDNIAELWAGGEGMGLRF